MTEEKRNSQDDADIDGVKTARINFIVPDNMRSVFANHFLVRHSRGGDFVLCFFEIDQPIRLGEPDEEDVTEVDAHCVAKLVVTKPMMASIIGAMAENFARSEAREKSHRDNKTPDSAEAKTNAG